MRFFTLDPAIYAGAFVSILILWPWTGCLPHSQRPGWQIALAVIVDYGLLLLVTKRTQSKRIGLWTGLVHIAGSRRMGCLNRTILALIPILLVVYLIAVVFTIVGIFRGKEWVEQMWLNTVTTFGSIDDTG